MRGLGKGHSAAAYVDYEPATPVVQTTPVVVKDEMTPATLTSHTINLDKPTVIVKPTSSGNQLVPASSDPLGDALRGIQSFFANLFKMPTVSMPKVQMPTMPKLGQANWDDGFPEEQAVADPYLGSIDDL